MSFGKALGIGIGVYLGANFGLGLLYELVGLQTQIDVLFAGDAILQTILGLLFMPAVTGPTGAIVGPTMGLIGGADLLPTILHLVVLFVPGLLAAILAGKFAESVGASFGTMFIIFLISTVLVMILFNFIIEGGDLLLTGLAGSSEVIALYLFPLLMGVINGIFYGGIAAVIAGREGF